MQYNNNDDEPSFKNFLSSTVNDDMNNNDNSDDLLESSIMDTNQGPKISRVPPGFEAMTEEERKSQKERVEKLRETSDEEGTDSESDAGKMTTDDEEDEEEKEREEDGKEEREDTMNEMVPRVLALQSELEAMKQLGKKKDEEIRKMKENKKELLELADELVEKVYVDKEDKSCGPSIAIKYDKRYVVPSNAVSSLEEGRWTVENRALGIQTEMGPTSTLRAREKITGEGKRRKKEVLGDWQGRNVKMVWWEDLEPKKKKSWRRRISKITKEIDRDIEIELARAETSMNEFQRLLNPGKNQEEEQEEERERKESGDSGIAGEKISRRQKKRKQKKEMEERRKDTNERREQPTTSTGKNSGERYKTVNIFGAERNEQREETGDETRNVLFGEDLRKENKEKRKGKGKRSREEKNDGDNRKNDEKFDTRQKLGQTTKLEDDEELL